MADPSSPSTPQTAPARDFRSAFNTQRARRQLGLFAAGAGFFGIATIITRRSIVRRYKATLPKFYQPSNKANHEVNGAMEAFDALNIATINVVSVAMMLTGGLLWALDISSIDDMRRKVRTKLGMAGRATDDEAEQEIEEWFASVLARKEFKALRGDIAKKNDAETSEEKKS